ncbi:hypothetical protein GCM10011322_16360 [Salinarimonas ramus]|uniref:HEPN domain-containing protein n=1 Tax=Salinarimonas ramus TaxID=690164 RepID=A0A917V3C2_9HYPH|nr:hypothetical protein GCM10011322_16360 [Salinarimonas ramus]
MKDETPLGWFNLAHAYLFDAAVLYTAKDRPQGGHYETPVRFLYRQAIELFVKAYLRTTGMSDNELSKRPYGHDLVRLIDEAETRGMLVTKRIKRVRDSEGAGDRQLETRYLRTGRARVLPPERLHEAARDLLALLQRRLQLTGTAIPPLPRLPVVHRSRRLTVAQAARLLRRL